MEKTLFNMKLTAKQLARESAKKEREQKDYNKRCLSSVGKNDEKMRMLAAEAIRCKNVSLQFMRLSLRMEAVASNV
jgi:charged multivesicular body protein 1